MPNKNPAAVALGALGGAVSGKMKTAKQTAARKRNGKLGGRPKKPKTGTAERLRVLN